MLSRRHNAQNRQATYMSVAMLTGALGLGALQNGVNQQVHADKLRANQQSQEEKLQQKKAQAKEAHDKAIASGRAAKVAKQTQKEVTVKKLAQVDKEVKAGKAKSDNDKKKKTIKKIYQINHRVKSGETIKDLAKHYNTKETNIQYLNDLEDPTTISVGQYLKIRVNDQSYGKKSAKLIASEKATAKAKAAAAKAKQDAQEKASKQSTSDTATSSNDDSTGTSSSSSSNYSDGLSASDIASRNWIMNRESGGSATARNGQYYGLFQLSESYLNGDFSVANQYKVANKYATSRYGSWTGAKQFWLTHGWY